VHLTGQQIKQAARLLYERHRGRGDPEWLDLEAPDRIAYYRDVVVIWLELTWPQRDDDQPRP
jgi:hypothetical protein